PRTLCEVTAHEVGHAAGLEHEYLCEDPMTYLRGCGEKSFQDVSSRCGTTEPRDCVCGPTQNTVAHLFDTFGPRPGADLEAPAVEILSPTESTFPAHSQVTVEVHA